MNIVGDVTEDTLIPTLNYKSESWVIDSNASFYAITNRECFKDYLGDDKTCNIIGKWDVQISLSNKGTLKLNNVRHAPSLKRNMLSIGQLASSGYTMTFTRDLWNVTKGDIIVAREKKECTFYLTQKNEWFHCSCWNRWKFKYMTL